MFSAWRMGSSTKCLIFNKKYTFSRKKRRSDFIQLRRTTLIKIFNKNQSAKYLAQIAEERQKDHMLHKSAQKTLWIQSNDPKPLNKFIKTL